MLKHGLVLGLALLISTLAAAPVAQQAAPALTDAQMEEFLLTARVVRTRGTEKGVTGSLRAVLSDGMLEHDAHIQTVDERKMRFESRTGVELNFRDSYRFNIAAYKIDRLLGLHLVPVSVERRWRSSPAAFTWWVDDVMMDEVERQRSDTRPPDPACWSEQMRMLRFFDQLIDNIDRNMGNILFTKNWRLWGIDHTRAFRFSREPRKPDHVTRIDRELLSRLQALEFRQLKQEVGRYITDEDIRNVLARRDAMVDYYVSHGEAALFDRRRPEEGCVAADR